MNDVWKGTDGVSTNGSLHISMCSVDEEGPSGTPANLLVSFQKCQGVSFFPDLSKVIPFAAAPLVLTQVVIQYDDIIILLIIVLIFIIIMIIMKLHSNNDSSNDDDDDDDNVNNDR